MQKNKNVLIALIAVFILAVFPMVLAAATTMTTPITGGNYTTTVSVAITTDATSVVNMSNVSCYYNVTGGAVELNSTYKLVEILNTTADQTSFTGSGAVTTEGHLYNITCFIFNDTTLNKTISVTAVTIDGTDPIPTLSQEVSTVNMYGVQKLTWSSTDATSEVESTSVTLTSPNTALCPTQTWTDSSATNYLIPDQYLACAGTYTVAMTVTDFSGNSASATSTTFEVNAPGSMGGSGVGVGGGGAPVTSGVISGPGGKSTSTLSWNTIFLIAILIGVIWYFVKRN